MPKKPKRDGLRSGSLPFLSSHFSSLFLAIPSLERSASLPTRFARGAMPFRRAPNRPRPPAVRLKPPAIVHTSTKKNNP